jgi:hypothetical protein
MLSLLHSIALIRSSDPEPSISKERLDESFPWIKAKVRSLWQASAIHEEGGREALSRVQHAFR